MGNINETNKHHKSQHFNANNLIKTNDARRQEINFYFPANEIELLLIVAFAQKVFALCSFSLTLSDTVEQLITGSSCYSSWTAGPKLPQLLRRSNTYNLLSALLLFFSPLPLHLSSSVPCSALLRCSWLTVGVGWGRLYSSPGRGGVWWGRQRFWAGCSAKWLYWEELRSKAAGGNSGGIGGGGGASSPPLLRPTRPDGAACQPLTRPPQTDVVQAGRAGHRCRRRKK